VVEDVIFPQLRRSAKRIVGILEDSDFKVIGSDVWCDKSECAILMELEVWELPGIRKVRGPPVFSEAHGKQFISKYKSEGRIMVKDGLWVAEAGRRYKTPDKLVRETLDKNRKKLAEAGIASYVAGSVVRGYRISKDEQIVRKAGRKKDFALFLTGYLKRKII
jgi:tRNA nucleotidyltransferase (CCA-adding enzyme)